MPNVITIADINAVRVFTREKLIRYNVRLSGAYVQAVRGTNVGEVLNLAAVAGLFQANQAWSTKGPLGGEVRQGPQGLVARIIPGADAFHWLLQLFSAGNELAAGAYSAAVLADLDVSVEFNGRNFD